MRTTDYLDAVKTKNNLTSDYQLAKLLELESANIRMCRKERCVMDDYIAARVAELLGIAEISVLEEKSRRLHEEINGF